MAIGYKFRKSNTPDGHSRLAFRPVDPTYLVPGLAAQALTTEVDDNNRRAIWCRVCGAVAWFKELPNELPTDSQLRPLGAKSGIICPSCSSTDVWGGTLDPKRPPWSPDRR